MTLFYQRKFIDGYGLVSAWREVPIPAIVSLCDTIRNRVLSFALELEGVLDRAGDNPSAVPAGTVTQHVTTIIYGGTNVVASAPDARINVGGDINLQQAGSIIEQIRKHQGELVRAGIDADALENRLSVVEQELASNKPDSGKLRSLLGDVRNALSGAAGNLIASGAITGLNALLGTGVPG
jgi:hypothetical protein